MIKPKSVERFFLENINKAFPRCENYFARFDESKKLGEITEIDILQKKIALAALSAFTALDLLPELGSRRKIKNRDAYSYSRAISYRTMTEALFCPKCIITEIIKEKDVVVYFNKTDLSVKKVKYGWRKFSEKMVLFEELSQNIAYRILANNHPHVLRCPYEGFIINW